MVEMFLLSLWQPHASLMKLAATQPEIGKTIETRPWKPTHPLPINVAIHAANKFPAYMKTACETNIHFVKAMRALDVETGDDLDKLPRSAIVAVGKLVHVAATPTKQIPLVSCWLECPPLNSAEENFGNYEPHRFMWFFEELQALSEPLPFTGHQGLRPMTPRDIARVRERL